MQVKGAPCPIEDVLYVLYPFSVAIELESL